MLKLPKKRKAMKAPELAALLRVSPQLIYKMAAAGKVPHLRIGGSIRFDPATIDEWLKGAVSFPRLRR